MKSLNLVLATLLFTAALQVRAIPDYKNRIPNAGAFLEEIGDNRALCAPNIFGQAFAEAGYQWTLAFCKEDTDKDGQTNGFELGDPQCCFVNGGTPHYDYSLSHPGDVTSTSARKPGNVYPIDGECSDAIRICVNIWCSLLSAMLASALCFFHCC